MQPPVHAPSADAPSRAGDAGDFAPGTDHPGWSAVASDAESDRLLLGRRLAYFGKAFFLLSLAFYVRNVTLIAAMEHRWPPLGHRSLLIHVAAMVLSGLQWFLCLGNRRSARTLALIDVVGLMGAMGLYGALTVSEA